MELCSFWLVLAIPTPPPDFGIEPGDNTAWGTCAERSWSLGSSQCWGYLGCTRFTVLGVSGVKKGHSAGGIRDGDDIPSLIITYLGYIECVLR